MWDNETLGSETPIGHFEPLHGGYGTLNEIAAALNLGKPVVGLKTWDVPAAGNVDPDLFHVAQTPKEAVETALGTM